MTEAVLIRYNISPAERVNKGDVLFEIETDKAALEVESPAEGFVKHLLAQIGQTVKVDDPVIVLVKKNEEISQDFIEQLKDQLKKTVDKDVPEQFIGQTDEPPQTKGFIETSHVTKERIKLGSTIPLSQKQKVIGRKMLWSKQNIPCFYLHVDADLTGLVELREKLNKTADVHVSYNDFLIYAIAVSLMKFPVMTGSLKGRNIILPENINVALAVELPDGVAAPVLKNLHGKSLSQIARERTLLVEKTQSGKLTLEDLEGACITISNLGSLGIDSFIPIVIPGQCSILGVGKITDTCRPETAFTTGKEEKIVIRKIMSLTLAVDHRIANGTQASQFLDFLRKYLEEPQSFFS